MPRRREAGTTGLTCEEKASTRVEKNIGSPEFLWMTGGRRSKGLFKAVRGAMPRPGLAARTIMHACPTRRRHGEGASRGRGIVHQFDKTHTVSTHLANIMLRDLLLIRNPVESDPT